MYRNPLSVLLLRKQTLCGTQRVTQMRNRSSAARTLPLLGLCVALTLSMGCSQLLGIEDTSNDEPDAGTVGMPNQPDAIAVPPGTASVVSIAPNVVIEAQGAARPTPIVLFGGGFEPDIRVRLVAGGAAANTILNGREVDVTVSDDGSVIAFALSMPVIPALRKGEAAIISFEIEQDGADVDVSGSIFLTLEGRDELVVSETFPNGQATANDFDPDGYSSVSIDSDLTLTGAEPARIHAIGPMNITATLSANGKAPLPGDVGLPGPGGCIGGSVDAAGGCLENGGQPSIASSDGGGGGGGHLSFGGPGNDDGNGEGGDGGLPSGNRYLIPLAAEGGGGGGGGGAGDNNSNATGGGGGGVLHLISEGRLTIGRDGFISANGGDGGVGVCNSVVELGSGGGGAGGALLIQAYGGIDDQDSSSQRVEVKGGDGGDLAPQDTCGRRGGNGALGRVRFDAPESLAPPFVRGTSLLTRGPAFAARPAIVTTPTAMLALVTEPSGEVTITSSNPAQPDLKISADSDGDGSAALALQPGINEMCVYVDEGFSREDQEPHCVNVAYVP